MDLVKLRKRLGHLHGSVAGDAVRKLQRLRQLVIKEICGEGEHRVSDISRSKKVSADGWETFCFGLGDFPLRLNYLEFGNVQRPVVIDGNLNRACKREDRDAWR